MNNPDIQRQQVKCPYCKGTGRAHFGESEVEVMPCCNCDGIGETEESDDALIKRLQLMCITLQERIADLERDVKVRDSRMLAAAKLMSALEAAEKGERK